MEEVQVIRAEREAAVAEKETIKKQYRAAKDGSLDKDENHARLCLALAKEYRALYRETELINEFTARHQDVLYRLIDSIGSEDGGANVEKATQLIEVTKPFLESGKSLLNSLAKIRNKITDPLLISKLNSAYDTAVMLSKYVKYVENGKANKHASQQIIRQKVVGLIDQLNALNAQTDIFMSMVRDKATMLKLITELAASESAINVITEGQFAVDQLSTKFMAQLIENLHKSDEDLNMTYDGVLSAGSGQDKNYSSQRWTDTNF
jgi:hypothetical protein